MKITNCKKNCMGTISFDGLFKGMRKPQDFIVYPMQDSGENIAIQSDHRFGKIDLATGAGVLSENRAQYANHPWFQLCLLRGTAVQIQLAAEDLQTLRGWIKSTGGPMVGGNNALRIFCDNTGAMAL
jgi:hypothetical protein